MSAQLILEVSMGWGIAMTNVNGGKQSQENVFVLKEVSIGMGRNIIQKKEKMSKYTKGWYREDIIRKQFEKDGHYVVRSAGWK